MKQLTPTARTVYIVLMVAAVVLDALLTLWLFIDASAGWVSAFLSLVRGSPRWPSTSWCMPSPIRHR